MIRRERGVGFDWNPAFCKYCNKFQVPHSSLLNRGNFFFFLILVKSHRVGRVGAILSAVEGAGQLHLLGYFEPFLFFYEGLILHDKVYAVLVNFNKKREI
ncbi:hypothetical protein RJT34_12151 [Clitoria ternatea]|uniref:Uncharacterized protein n=1 Tax=Clitoria ternatea TaxID=43366 RepID=A0AAN9JL83_CLITE